MSALEHFDQYDGTDYEDYMEMAGEDDGDVLYPFGGSRTCRYCGFGPLSWGQDENGKWRLGDDEHGVHKCAEYREAHDAA